MTHRPRLLGVAGTTVLAAVVVATVATSLPASAVVDPGRTEVVSSSAVGPADGASWGPRVSADGRFVAFTSQASTLVAGDTNGTRDVFVTDRADGSVERVSLDEQGGQLTGHSDLAALSADGRYVLLSTTELVQTVRVAATTLSGNGRFALFTTNAGLVARDGNEKLDLYRVDLVDGRVRLVSTGIPSDAYRESRWPSISHSGRFVAFEFTAPLVRGDRLDARDIYVRDLTERRPRLVTLSSAGVQADRGSMAPAISAGGRYVVYSSYATTLVRGDTNGDWDVFWHDRRTGRTERVSVSSRGRQGDAQSQGPGFWGTAASVSRDGRRVVFGSSATNLSPATDDQVADVYVRDRGDRTTTALSLTPAGDGADGDSGDVQVSADGSTAVFSSSATNLVADDGNGVDDVFVRRLGD